jgi:thiamine monophosphate synthase
VNSENAEACVKTGAGGIAGIRRFQAPDADEAIKRFSKFNERRFEG